MKFESARSLKELIGKKAFTLASSSPRRIEFLKKAGIEFDVKTPKVSEEKISKDPIKFVLALSRMKAESVLSEVENGLILGADTIVVSNRRILGKPKDSRKAVLMLKGLSDREHRVYTGLTLVDKDRNKIFSDYQCTKVRFKRLCDREIKDYVSSGKPLDKAGAYGIQDKGGFLVKGIDGPLDNVIGLPMEKLKEMVLHITGGGNG